MHNPTHPALLFKRILAEYIGSFIPPGSPEGAVPEFGKAQGFPVVHDEDKVDETLLQPAGPDILIEETGQSEEVHEGLGVWRLTITVTLTVCGDKGEDTFRELDNRLWKYLSSEYAGDVSSGGDIPGPLAGKLTGLSRDLSFNNNEEFPEVLCVGDVWGVKRFPPTMDSPATRIMQYQFLAIAEVMPSSFTPPAP